MFSYIKIQNFKCFDTFEMPLSNINLFTGYNGAGKSTIFQAILIIAQSIRNGELRDLTGNGVYVKMGRVDSLVKFGSDSSSFRIDIDSDEEIAHQLSFSFSPDVKNPRKGVLKELLVNGENQFALSAPIQGVEVGMSPDNLARYEDKVTLQTSDWTFLNVFKNINYISASRLGPTLYEERAEPDSANPIGNLGEHKLEILIGNEDLQEKISKDIKFIMESENLMSLHSEDMSGSILSLSFHTQEGHEVQSINTGFGFSFIIPILIALEHCKKGTIFIENPEAHLHPRAQSRFMQLIAQRAIENNNQIFVESHSEHILNGMRLAVLQDDNLLKKENVVIEFFGANGECEKLNMDDDAQIDSWPEGFFDQQQADSSEILRRGLLR